MRHVLLSDCNTPRQQAHTCDPRGSGKHNWEHPPLFTAQPFVPIDKIKRVYVSRHFRTSDVTGIIQGDAVGHEAESPYQFDLIRTRDWCRKNETPRPIGPQNVSTVKNSGERMNVIASGCSDKQDLPICSIIIG